MFLRVQSDIVLQYCILDVPERQLVTEAVRLYGNKRRCKLLCHRFQKCAALLWMINRLHGIKFFNNVSKYTANLYLRAILLMSLVKGIVDIRAQIKQLINSFE